MTVDIQAADCTQSDDGGVTVSALTVTLPAYASGDLIIINIGMATYGENPSQTISSWGTMPHGETVNEFVNNVGPSDGIGNQTVLAIAWFEGGGTYAGGDVTITPDNDTRSYHGVIKVPAADGWDTTKPISDNYDASYSPSAAATIAFDAFDAASDDEDGNVIGFVVCDQRSLTNPSSGWETSFIGGDVGRVGGDLSRRTADAANSTEIASASWSLSSSDFATAICYIVRQAPAGGVGGDTEILLRRRGYA